VTATVRRRWALTAVPGAVLLAVVAWPSVQGAPPVLPTEVPARAAPPAARPAPVVQRPRAPRVVVPRRAAPAAVAPRAPRPAAPPPQAVDAPSVPVADEAPSSPEPVLPVCPTELGLPLPC
jgi:translation initiation factor IF-2